MTLDELTGLEHLEQELSARRTRLQEQVLFIRANRLGGDLGGRLARLEQLERSVSEERRRLHGAIDEARLALGLGRWERPPRGLER